MVGEPLARAGVFAFAFTLAVPFVGGHAEPAKSDVTVAAAFEASGVQGLARAPQRVRDGLIPEAVAAVETTPDPTPESTPSPTPRPAVKAPAPHPVPLPSLEPPPTAGIVLASWYGPGFYGNRTACGQTYTPEILGVAHRTLPCGTLVVLSYGTRSVTVAVIDRGPYVAGRTLDLSSATRQALGCPDLCTLSMRAGG